MSTAGDFITGPFFTLSPLPPPPGPVGPIPPPPPSFLGSGFIGSFGSFGGTTGSMVVAPYAQVPTARIAVDPAFGVIGSVVRLDGRGSTDPDGKLLSYKWTFQSVPIGSKVALEGFRTLDVESDPSAPIVGSPTVVSFSPDIVGEYVIGLVVSNGAYESLLATQVVSTRAIMVPHGRGLVPDGKFIWSYLRDVWTQVEDREWFETLWSALIQIVGSEMLKLYQVDYNKSIRDIQEKMQRRWLSYEPKLTIDQNNATFILDYQQAGTAASTVKLGSSTQDVLTGGSFYVPYNNGSNDLSTMIPGRIVVVGDQAYTVVRSLIDKTQPVPITLLVTDTSDVSTGLTGLSWRAAHTLLSTTQNFSDLGVTAGDLLTFDLLLSGTQSSVEVQAQVVGVDRNRLAFVLTNQPTIPGTVAQIPNDTYLNIAAKFNLRNVVQQPDGSLAFSNLAGTLLDNLKNGSFQKKYLNTELNPFTTIQASGLNFNIKPKSITRNRYVPVDDDLISVPLLQEYIKPPELTQLSGGSYGIIRKDQVFKIPAAPRWLSENVDFTIDDKIALNEKLTFRTGSSIIDSDAADFVDRNVNPGDVFTIVKPATMAGDYIIQSVLGPGRVKLTRPVPKYAISDFVTAQVKVTRKHNGRFIRFTPGKFSTTNPAPARLWAEASFFDNSQSVEDNFGILVGLKKTDLEEVTANLTYRQAVTGLMYALTRGSAVSKIELGIKILLGLPFAEHRGIVRSIENDYRLANDGTSILGRLLVEDVDANGTSLGAVRVYTYPTEGSVEMAGVDVNPATGLPYVVGDIVERLASLSKGVEILDYQNDPLQNPSVQQTLQQYHSFRARVSDNIFGVDELNLVSDFLKKITPSYIAYVISLATELVDTKPVTDFLFRKVGMTPVDAAGMGLPFAVALDQRDMNGVPVSHLDIGFAWSRRFGRDLSTTAGSALATSLAGGLLNPKTNETFEAPLSKVGDKLIIFGGPNNGTYTVSAVTNTTVTVSDAPTTGFVDAVGQIFAVVRPIAQTLRSGSASVTTATAQVVLGAGLRTIGVMPGDWVIFDNTNIAGGRFRVISVDQNAGSWDRVTLTPTPVVTAGPVTSNFRIVRPTFIEAPTTETFSVTSSGTNALTGSGSFRFLQALCDIGDELQLQRPDLLRVTVIDPVRMIVTPTLPAGTYTVALAKKKRGPSALTVGSFQRNAPQDQVDLIVNSQVAGATSNATSVAGNPTISITGTGPFEIGAKPGDFLILIGGTDGGVDVGYGPGVFPILNLSAGLVTVTTNMTASSSVMFWKVATSR